MHDGAVGACQVCELVVEVASHVQRVADHRERPGAWRQPPGALATAPEAAQIVEEGDGECDQKQRDLALHLLLFSVFDGALAHMYLNTRTSSLRTPLSYINICHH